MHIDQWILTFGDELRVAVQCASCFMIVCGIVTCIFLLSGFKASYGRYSKETRFTKVRLCFGTTINNKVCKRIVKTVQVLFILPLLGVK